MLKKEDNNYEENCLKFGGKSNWKNLLEMRVKKVENLIWEIFEKI